MINVKKKEILAYSLVFLILFTAISHAQVTFIPTDETEEEGLGSGDILGFFLSLLGVAIIVILRFLNIIPDALYNPLMILSLLGFFYALQTLFDSIGFELNIGGIVIPPLAIGFILILLVYHGAILQLLSLIRR